MSEDSAAEMRRAAMNWLARRDYAREELARRLSRRFGEQPALGETLDWLEAQGFLDEARFAEVFVRNRIERGQGPLRIRRELEQRGVAEPHLEAALEQAECDWFDLARRVRARRFTRLPGSDPREKARQLRFLQYRGFSAEQAFHALDAGDAGEEHDPADLS